MAQNFLSDIQLGDNTYIRLGSATDGDFQIFHDGTNSQIAHISGTGTSHLLISNYVDNGDVIIRTDDGSGSHTEYFRADGETGSVSLYHYGSEKIKTTSTGVTITGTLSTSGGGISVGAGNFTMGDLDGSVSGKIALGNAGDFEFYHSGTTSQIRNNTGDLYISALEDDSDIVFYADNGVGTTQPRLTINGATGSVSLNHYTSTKLATTSAGVDISGDISIDGALNFQKTGFTTITGSSNTFTINFATEKNNYQFTLDNAACTIAFSNLGTSVVGKSGNIIITNPSSVGSLSVGNLPSTAYSPGGATVSWDTNASSVSILSYFILASDKVLINYVGNFKSYGT